MLKFVLTVVLVKEDASILEWCACVSLVILEEIVLYVCVHLIVHGYVVDVSIIDISYNV